MAALETVLRILAKDDTAAAFASVETRIKALQTQIGAVGALAAGPAAAASAVASAAPAAAASAAAAAGAAASEAARARDRAEASSGGLWDMVGSLAAMATGYAAIRGGYQEAMAQQHERMRQELSAMSPTEIAEGETLAADLAQRYPSVAQSDIMHGLRTGRTVTGSFEDSKQLLERLTQLRVIAAAANPRAGPEEMTEQFDALIKAMEIANVTQDPERFARYTNDIAKALNAFGDQLKPIDYFEMLKYGRGASPNISERFLMTTLATLGTEIGGPSIGTALASFNRAVVGGRMGMREGKALGELGLVDERDLIKIPGTGEIKGTRRGAHVKDWRLAQSDPDLWITQDLLPALRAHGATTPEEIAAQISQLFSNRMAADLVTKIATQEKKLGKNTELFNQALALPGADTLAKRDAETVFKGLGNTITRTVAQHMPTELGAAIGNGLISAVSAAGRMLAPAPEMRNFGRDVEADWNRLVGPGGFKFGAEAARSIAEDKRAAAQAAADAERARASLYGAGYREKFTWGPLWDRHARPDSLEYEQGLEARRGRALSGMAPQQSPPSSISVGGQASVEQTIRVQVDASPELKATVETLKNLRYTIPLAATGRMDGDAAPHRGIGHM